MRSDLNCFFHQSGVEGDFQFELRAYSLLCPAFTAGASPWPGVHIDIAADIETLCQRLENEVAGNHYPVALLSCRAASSLGCPSGDSKLAGDSNIVCAAVITPPIAARLSALVVR